MFDAMQLGQQVILVRIAVRYIVLTTRAVLFSILILHWATSLDRSHESAAAAESSNTPQGSATLCAQGSSNTPKSSSVHAGVPRGPCVTTNVGAGKRGHDADDDNDDDDNDDDDNMIVDSVLAKTHHAHEVEMNDLRFERERHGNEGSMVRAAADPMV